ncbi:MAG: right-handed parallel beta-helix repeat-containing protein [Gemmataceae bacterium]
MLPSLLILANLSMPAASTQFHVAAQGNDARSGRLVGPNATRTDGPFATLTRARDAARQLRKSTPPEGPITIRVEGRHFLREPLVFTPEDSGTKSSPLIIEGKPGSGALLSGGRVVQPRVEKGLWVIPAKEVKGVLGHLVVGGTWRSSARWPKSGTFPIAGLAGADPRANYRTPADRFEYAAGQIEPAWAMRGDVEVIVLHFWVDGHFLLRGVDAEKRLALLDRKSLRRLTEDGGSSGKPGRFYLRNVPRDLEPGEFHHDVVGGVIRYRPATGEQIETTQVVLPHLESLVRFQGKPEAGQWVEHIELRNLTLSDSNFVPDAKNAGDVQAAQHVRGAIHLRGARHCTLGGCRLTHLGGYGIELADGCRQNEVTRNELTQLGGGGIRLSGGVARSPEHLRTGENRITNNHLHQLGKLFHAGIGILAQHTDRNEIAHNHIHHLYYTGISIGWVWGYAPSVSVANRVEGNHIHDIGQGLLSDMGGIYMLGISPGTVVRHNVLHDIESFGYGGWGIYTDEGSSNILIENNLVYRTKSGGFHQHYGRENIVRNNIFALAREGQLMRSRPEAHQSFTLERNIIYADGSPIYAKTWKDGKFRTDYNLFWDTSGKAPSFPGGSLAKWQAQGHDQHSLVADPRFVDPAGGDFRLKPDSPAEKIGFRPFDPRTAGVRPVK